MTFPEERGKTPLPPPPSFSPPPTPPPPRGWPEAPRCHLTTTSAGSWEGAGSPRRKEGGKKEGGKEGRKEGGKEGVTCWAIAPGCPCRTPRLARGGCAAPPATAFQSPPTPTPGQSRRRPAAGRPSPAGVCTALPAPLRRPPGNVERIKRGTVFPPLNRPDPV